MVSLSGGGRGQLHKYMLRYGFECDDRKGCTYSGNLRTKSRPELYTDAQALDVEPAYAVEKLCEKFHVEVVWLPVAHPYLNVIEYAWARLKTHVAHNNEKVSLKDCNRLVAEECDRFSGRDYAAILRDQVIPYDDAFLENPEKMGFTKGSTDADDDDETG